MVCRMQLAVLTILAVRRRMFMRERMRVAIGQLLPSFDLDM